MLLGVPRGVRYLEAPSHAHPRCRTGSTCATAQRMARRGLARDAGLVELVARATGRTAAPRVLATVAVQLRGGVTAGLSCWSPCVCRMPGAAGPLLSPAPSARP